MENTNTSICTFDELYTLITETLCHSGYVWNVERHGACQFTIELDEHYWLSAHDAARKDECNIRLEIYYDNKLLTHLHQNYSDVYAYIIENVIRNHGQSFHKLGNRMLQRKCFTNCMAGALLILFSAFLIFAVWLSRSTDAATPLYVYLALTFTFGLVILCGVGLILSAIKRTPKRDCTSITPSKKDTDVHMTEIPLEHISTIVKSNIYYVGNDPEEEGGYTGIAPKKCASAWYKKYHEKTAFSFIRRIQNRYIGNRAWVVGGTSYISLCVGRKTVKFTIHTPADTTSAEYLLAREKWDNVIRKIYDAGWLLFDEM